MADKFLSHRPCPCSYPLPLEPSLMIDAILKTGETVSDSHLWEPVNKTHKV